MITTITTEFFLTGGVTSSQLKLKNKRKSESKKGKGKVSISSRHSSVSGGEKVQPPRGKFPPRFAGVATFVKGKNSCYYHSLLTLPFHPFSSITTLSYFLSPFSPPPHLSPFPHSILTPYHPHHPPPPPKANDLL